MDIPTIDDKLLKAAQVAEILMVSKSQAYRLMDTELTCVRFGSATVRVRLGDLQKYIEDHLDLHRKEQVEFLQSGQESADV